MLAGGGSDKPPGETGLETCFQGLGVGVIPAHLLGERGGWNVCLVAAVGKASLADVGVRLALCSASLPAALGSWKLGSMVG